MNEATTLSGLSDDRRFNSVRHLSPHLREINDSSADEVIRADIAVIDQNLSLVLVHTGKLHRLIPNGFLPTARTCFASELI